MAEARFRIGGWRVDAGAGTIVRDDATARGSATARAGESHQAWESHQARETVRVDPRTMRVLVCLMERAGQVVSSEELLDSAWAGVAVSQDSVYQAVASLRRILGDDPRQPAYIATVPRMGYRLVAAVEPWSEDGKAPLSADAPIVPAPPSDVAGDSAGGRGRIVSRGALAWSAAALVCLALAGWWLVRGKGVAGSPAVSAAAAGQPQRSIAVVPFLDLTEGMKEEEFADGMTEELIGRLSKIPGLRVPGPTASFFYKDKQVAPAELGRALSVTWLLDGSVRKAGKRLRVSARLLRADTSYVLWTESYDRSLDDILKVQDEIAGEVTKALRGNLDGTSSVR